MKYKKYSEEVQEKVDALIMQIMRKSASLTSDEIECFMTLLNLTSTAVLRGINGDKFVQDFLTAALVDKEPFVIKLHPIH